VEDNWDDYNFKILFEPVATDTRGQRHEVGTVKIMKFGMTGGRVDVPRQFDALSPQYCSLGHRCARQDLRASRRGIWSFYEVDRKGLDPLDAAAALCSPAR
jgi:hypothetical protein